MSTKESDSNVDLSVSFADKQVDLDRANYSVNDDESLFESLLNNDNKLDRTNVDNLCIILEEIRSTEERLDQKINNIALNVCRIKEADILKSLLSRDRVICNQLTERVYTKVRTVKPSVQTREHIDHPNSVLTESPIAPKDNKDECDKDECDAKAVETNYNGVLHTTSNESINEMIETSIITQQKPNYAEVVALSSALVNSAKTSEQSKVS